MKKLTMVLICCLVLVGCERNNIEDTFESSGQVVETTQTEASKVVKEIIKDENIEILGPNPCIVSKIKENYRYQIILKGKFNEKLRKKIKDSLYELNKSVYNDIRISIDINPNNLL